MKTGQQSLKLGKELNKMLAEGDIVWVDFDPVRGTEQSGARPAIVVSVEAFNTQSHRAIVCPITKNMSPWPTKVFLPKNFVIKGAILTDQIRSVDRHQRGFRKVAKAPDAILSNVRDQISALLGLMTHEDINI